MQKQRLKQVQFLCYAFGGADQYIGRSVAEAHARIIGLFRMQILDEDRVIERVRGKPVYLGLAMSPARRLRMKPQNLIVNMPLRQGA